VASLYRSGTPYATVFNLGLSSPQLAVPALPISGGGGGGSKCPTLGTCDANCVRTVTPCVGKPYPASCCGTGFSCAGGTCVCPAPNTACGTVCTNTQTDPNNCGTCGNNCNGGTCVAGKCDCSSAPGLSPCGATCVNLQTDANNCGSCGNECLPGVGCNGGKCYCPGPQTWGNIQNTCVAGQTLRQISADLNNVPSGWSGVDTCYCTLGPAGTPAAGTTPYLCTQQHILGIAGSVTGHWNITDATCCTSQGLSVCGTNCVNLSSDPQNCRACGKQCSATQICQNGMCVACPAGTGNCNNANLCCSPLGCCTASNGTFCCDPGLCAVDPSGVPMCCSVGGYNAGTCCDNCVCTPNQCSQGSTDPCCGVCC
jgi:hypothetical protein